MATIPIYHATIVPPVTGAMSTEYFENFLNTTMNTTSGELITIMNHGKLVLSWREGITLPPVNIEITSFTASQVFPKNPFTSKVYPYLGGDSIDLIFDWSTNIPPTSLTLEIPSNVYSLDPGSQTFTAPTFNVPGPGTYEWFLYASDNTSQDAATVTITWAYPTYYGESVNDLTSGDPFRLLVLSTIRTPSRENQTLTFNATNEYIYFATPGGALTTILDANGLDVTSSFSLTVVTDIYDPNSGNFLSYWIYKSNSLMTTNQNFQFIF
jgi:hypothetical protein